MITPRTAIIRMMHRLIPRRIRNSIFHLAYHLAPNEFDRFSYEYAHAPDMERGLQAMANKGFSPVTIIDVGAFEGAFSRMAKRIWPTARSVMVEPNLAKKAALTQASMDLGAQVFNELVGSTEGQEVQFYVMGTGSSVMEESSPRKRSAETRRLRRLDSLVTSIEAPALLKIDAQGYELEILRGATSLIPNVDAVLLEVAIIEINKGAPLMHAVLTFMKELGFVTYDLLEIHRRPLDNALNQVDIIFVREDSVLIADKRHYADS